MEALEDSIVLALTLTTDQANKAPTMPHRTGLLSNAGVGVRADSIVGHSQFDAKVECMTDI